MRNKADKKHVDAADRNVSVLKAETFLRKRRKVEGIDDVLIYCFISVFIVYYFDGIWFSSGELIVYHAHLSLFQNSWYGNLVIL